MKRAALMLTAIALSGATALAGQGGVRICGKSRVNPVRALQGISARMHKVKDKLEAEHHGARVLLAQREVLKRLDALIKEVEKQQAPPHGGKPDPKKRPKPPRGPKRPSANPSNEGDFRPSSAQNPSRPMEDEFLTTGGKPPAGMHKDRARLSGVGGKWGELPAKVRRRIIQARSTKLPDRYRRMIELYLMAIAEEDGR